MGLAQYKLYSIWYKKLGLRKVGDFIHPKAINIEDIVFPRYSIFHYYSVHKDDYISRNIPIFRNISKGIVTNILDFKADIPFKKIKNINELSFTNSVKKQSTDFITVPYSKLLLMLKSKKNFLKDNRLIINYSYLGDNYHIPDTPKTIEQLYDGIYGTIFTTYKELLPIISTKNKEQHHFFIYKLPNVNIGLPIINKYLENKPLDIEGIKVFYTYNRLFLLDLYRIFSKELYKLTVLKPVITEKEFNNLHILLIQDDKVIVVNYSTLLSFSKDYDILPNNNKFSPEQMRRLFAVFLKIVYSMPSFRLEDIEKGKNVKFLKEKLNPSITKKITNEDLKEDSEVVYDIKDLETKLEDEEEIDEDTLKEKKEDEVALNDILNMVEDEFKTEEEINEEHTKVPIETLDELLTTKHDPIKEIERIIEFYYQNDLINKNKYKRYKELLKQVMDISSPYDKNKKLKDMITILKEEVEISEKDKKLPNIEQVPDPSMLEDTITAFDKKYIKNVLRKDIISTVFSLQRSGMIISEYNVETHDDILGPYEEHFVTFKDIKGGTYNLKFKIPVVNEDGIFYMSGNKYRLRKSRLDLPIKKIKYNRVALSSAYGKLFIDKAPYNKSDRGYNLKRQLLKLQEANKIKNLVLGNEIPPDIKLPEDYYLFMRYVKSFVKDSYSFNFDYINRADLLTNKKIELKDLEQDNYILVGMKNSTPILIDMDNVLYEYNNGNYKKLGNIIEFIGINPDDLLVEYSLVKIYKSYVPVFYMLCYYLTFNKLLKLMKVKYTKTDKKIVKKQSPTDIIIKTKFDTYIIHPKNATEQMIFEGYKYWEKYAKNVPINTFNNRGNMEAFFKEVGLRIVDINEIKVLEHLYLDPVTINILEEMNEPVTLVGLLIRASEMLTTDYYGSQVSINGYLIRGYDKVPQMIYQKIVESIRTKLSEEFFGKSRLTFDPYSIWRIMNEDSTSILVDDLNPIIYLKQKEDTTYTGFLGRKKESMAKSTREYHPDNIGVISEATKDSGDVAVTAYLSANPILKDIRGLKDKNKKKLSMTNILSTSALLAPFSIYDDPKRVNFINIQNTHIIPMNEMIVYPVRTGYEAILPYRVGKKYVDYAKEDGKVLDVSKGKIKVKYKSGKEETFIYSDWVSKEESHTAYKHILVPNVEKGQTVKQGDVIYYDSSFFEPDMFDKTKVVYRAHRMVRTATIETNDTYEDSAAISSKLIEKAGIKYVKTRSIILDKTDVIKNVKKVGDKVEPSDALFTITVNDLEFDTSKAGDLDKVMDLMEGFINTTPRAKIKGKIIKIKVFYNCEKEELSKSLRELVDTTEEYLNDEVIDRGVNKKYTGKVDSSYSIEGIPLEQGQVEIKYYIETDSTLTVGDKGIFGNQLKFTIGEIYEYPFKTEDGRDVEALFSNRSIMARVVNSAYIMGTTATILRLLTENVVKMYFGEEEEK